MELEIEMDLSELKEELSRLIKRVNKLEVMLMNPVKFEDGEVRWFDKNGDVVHSVPFEIRER